MQNEKRNWHQDKKTIESLKNYTGDDEFMLNMKTCLFKRGLTHRQIDIAETFFEVQPYRQLVIKELRAYEGDNAFVLSCKEYLDSKGFLTASQVKALKSNFSITANFSNGKKGVVQVTKRVTLKEMGIDEEIFDGLQDIEFEPPFEIDNEDI